MNVGKNENDNEYNFVGATLGYTLNSSWGEGNYRITVAGTDEEFVDKSGTDDDEALVGGGLSFDRQLDDH